ncbi:MAG: family 78 glycoside hydrolase catalytic domain [Candidatus Cyclobacteriaceae bacterium M3_2C_046]
MYHTGELVYKYQPKNYLLNMIKLFLTGFFSLGFLISQAQLQPEQLTCEYVKNPSVVDQPHPRLAWVNIDPSEARGQEQTAWQIRVASSPEQLDTADLWDSGKKQSSQSTRVTYQGEPLNSRQNCWWQVRVWDKDGQVSNWSEPAFWRMGLLNPSAWKAQWIGAPWQGEEEIPKPNSPAARPEEMPPPAPMMRKSFNLSKPVAEAVAFVTGLGYFELYLNGDKVGDDVLVPNQTNYGKRPELPDAPIPLQDNFRKYKVMYLAYDVKDQLRQGENVIGSMLGNGFYNPAKFWAGGYGTPRFIGQLHITYEDGTEEIIVSDPTWKAAKSAILMDMVFYGEHYDARQEQPGWSSPGFDDSGWKNVVLRKAPEGVLVAHTPHPDKVMEQLEPVSIEKLAEGKYKVDFGKEISGWLRLKNAEGPAGHKVDINYICNTYSGDNSYIFRGEGRENYAARFNWFVFSGVEISNWPGELQPDQLVAEAVNTYVEESATFETSNPMFNQINQIWKRSQLDNMHGGIASDCPHRERSGYTGDGQVACVTVMHNYDARSFYYKWIQDMYEAQNVATGYVPNGAPWQPGCGGGVAWGSAICIMPWEFYLHYGDKDMLKDNYPGMKAYIRYMQNWVKQDGIMHMQRTGKDGKVLKWFNLGEWAAPGETVPDKMVHTFYFWRSADFTAKTARALGKEKEAVYYAGLAKKTWQAFHDTFYDANNHTYGKAGGNVFALEMGVPEDRYQAVVQTLQSDIEANQGHLDTGIFGTQFLFEVLAENGLNELAYEMMNKKTYPSYGHWLERGATTTWEHWDGHSSQNHPMFGGGISWFYRKLAGMQADPANPGYRHIIFKPQPVEAMDFVTYENNTAFGVAGISWEKEQEAFKMDIKVPVGSTATVYIPTDDLQKISENGKPLKDAEGVEVEGMEDGSGRVELVSGRYQFTITK